MHKLNKFVAAALLTLVAGSACGGEDDGDGGGGDDFSLPDSAVLGTLTDAQSETLCKETKAYLSKTGLDQDQKELTCRLAGLFATFPADGGLPMSDAALQAACKTGYDPCIASAPEEVSCTKPTATCTATVGEYKACLSEAESASGEGLALLPACSELTLAKWAMLIAGGTNQIPPLPACTTFEDKCPDLDLPIPEIPET